MADLSSDAGSMTQTSPFKGRPRKRIQPLKAWRAVKALLADKEDTAQVFKVIDALSGGSDERQFFRFMGMETGKRIIAEKRNILQTLNDRETLSRLPEGSLGHLYYKFMSSENLTADGLVEASEVIPDREKIPEAAKIYRNRQRDTHDLWHVSTGYGRDGLGELCLLAFIYAQTGNRGIGAIVLFGLRATSRSYPGLGLWKAVREGYRLGKVAKWLPGTDWEALLSRPLDEVRAELNLGPLVHYKGALASVQALEAHKAKLAEAEAMKLAA
ncbi:MAG: hypothetical protein GC184_08185 [Rhizobiales bacterium]|nr:hypothetical protein [Hyphomicrobiales bacterium]